MWLVEKYLIGIYLFIYLIIYSFIYLFIYLYTTGVRTPDVVVDVYIMFIWLELPAYTLDIIYFHPLILFASLSFISHEKFS